MLFALFVANLKMLFRNRQALFWALVFPLIFVVVFGLFSLDEPPAITLAVVDYAHDDLSTKLVEDLGRLEALNVESRPDEVQARKELKNGDLRYLMIIPKDISKSVAANTSADIDLVYDQSTPVSGVVISVVERFLDQVNLTLAGSPQPLKLRREGVIARHLDYFDFLLPGFVGMGVMSFSIIGIGSVMAIYREQKILKRILATPLRVHSFFSGMILAYLLLSLVQAAVILIAGMLLFGGDVYGNYFYLILLVLVGNMVFLNVGFIVGAFSKNVSAASGLGNAVSIPMMFFSGVFFPKEDLPRLLANLVEYLPLSPMLDAMRGVALDARPLWDFPQELGILGAWIAVTSLLAVRVFRFS